MTTVGVLFAPPLRLTTATVRGPGQCWLTVRMSSRSASSSGEGYMRKPRRLRAPRQPRVAGWSTGALMRNEVSLRLCRVAGSAAAAVEADAGPWAGAAVTAAPKVTGAASAACAGASSDGEASGTETGVGAG